MKKTRKSIANSIRWAANAAIEKACEAGVPTPVTYLSQTMYQAAALVESSDLDSETTLALDIFYNSPLVMSVLTDPDRYARIYHAVEEESK